MNNLKKFIRQFCRYLFAGGIAAVIDILTFYICSSIVGINYLIANTIAFIFGLIVNFIMTKFWVFESNDNTARAFILYALTGVIGLFIGNGILYLLIDCRIIFLLSGINKDGLISMIAKCLSVIIVLFWNFFSRKFFVFRNPGNAIPEE